MQTLPQDCRLSSERLKLLLSTLPTAADICRHGFIEDSHRLLENRPSSLSFQDCNPIQCMQIIPARFPFQSASAVFCAHPV
jgi:hypothetical protein